MGCSITSSYMDTVMTRKQRSMALLIGAADGIHGHGPSTEEPCDAKASCTVLKASGTSLDASLSRLTLL